MDKLIAEKIIPPFILAALPFGETLADFDSWLTDTVIPVMEKRFHSVAWKRIRNRGKRIWCTIKNSLMAVSY